MQPFEKPSLLHNDIAEKLVASWPDHSSKRLVRDNLKIWKDESKCVSGHPLYQFEDSQRSIKGTIYPDYSVHVVGTGDGTLDSWKLIWELSPGLKLNELGRIKHIENQTTFDYQRDQTTDMALLKGTGNQNHARIQIIGPYSGNPYVCVQIDGRESKVPKKESEWLMETITSKAVQFASRAHGLTLYQLNVINGDVTINAQAADSSGEFEVLLAQLLEYSRSHKLRKQDGFIYEPIPGCPCAYRELCTYQDFINDVLMENPLYVRNPRRYDEAIKYLTNYRDTKLPLLKPDRNLLSFSNGVLQLSTSTFYGNDSLWACEEGSSASEIVGCVTRHHIPHPYTGSKETPMLDIVLQTQFEDDVAQLLCAMFGRVFFKVGELDKWQVMPYLVGLGGTGKSLLLKMLSKCFNTRAVGNLASKREEVFGMANLVDKEVIIGRDLPAKLSGSISQENIQTMTSGEEMEIARKNATALNLNWTAPCVMSSNHMPDYINTGNNIGRRLVTFRFDNRVKDPREDLEDILITTELPNIICRCLEAYTQMRQRVKERGSFWKSVPDTLLEWQSRLASATNKLHQFLSSDEDERVVPPPGSVGLSTGSRVKIDHCIGSVTLVHDFKAAYEACNGKGSFKADAATFDVFGFGLSPKPVHICKACKQVARSRAGGCCDKYDRDLRAKKDVLYDMKLVIIAPSDIPSGGGCAYGRQIGAVGIDI